MLFTSLDSMLAAGITLQQVEDYYRAGLISEALLAEYLEAWNTRSFRFTRAEWRDGAIRQTPRD